MNKIMITCPVTGKHVSTGIITDRDTFNHLPVALSSMNCPHCGVATSMDGADAWLRDEKPLSGDLPGGVLFLG